MHINVCPAMQPLTPVCLVEDLFAIIETLKSSPDVARGELVEGILRKLHDQEESAPREQEQERAINLAVRVMTMVNCSTHRQSSILLEHGVHKVPWRRDATLGEFLINIFPITDHPR